MRIEGKNYCGSWECHGHGDNAICGKPWYVGLFQCASCQLKDEQERHQWSPIDTAPRDGTWMDLWAVPTNGAPAGRFTNMHWFAGCFRFPSFSSVPGQYGEPLSADATHWRAIPESP